MHRDDSIPSKRFTTRLSSMLPIVQWLPRYDPSWLRPDLVAGITLAAYAIPVSLAYASLAGLPPERRGARYVCVLAFAEPMPGGGAPRIVTARGTCRGRIATAPKGTGGFGYDPIFEPESEPPGGRTLGEWSAEAKNRISHRARAARRMAPKLAARGY